jgi:hypothetical protein
MASLSRRYRTLWQARFLSVHLHWEDASGKESQRGGNRSFECAKARPNETILNHLTSVKIRLNYSNTIQPFSTLPTLLNLTRDQVLHRVPDYDLFIYQYICINMDINPLYII